jgi:hypothetical protein
LQLVFKVKSIFAQQVEKIKGSGTPKEKMIDTHKANQQADFANHQFGKKSHHIVHIQINFCI